ncbi:hypothetical protein V0288_14400 [Pannus brasiliensis CCIBt3594]|uniref:Uncharacterized protein n=1 Tax=Pannus brasiliensis CCIBt3594 TaxID=1427578 RepID=A0AAW9QKJ6_9CHRO
MSSIAIDNLPPEVIDRLQILADRHELSRISSDTEYRLPFIGTLYRLMGGVVFWN